MSFQVNRRRCIAAIVMAVGTLAGGTARADVGPPVKITMPPRSTVAAVSGEEYVGKIEILAHAAGSLEDFELKGTGWDIQSLTGGEAVEVVAGQVMTVAFRALPRNEAEPLHVRVRFDGRSARRSFRLGREEFARMGMPGRVASLDANGRIGPFQPQLSTTSSNIAGQALRLHGRIAYLRPSTDGGPQDLQVGADGIYYEVRDDDSPDPFDEVIYSGQTDPYGNFDVAVAWDDCDFTGCDDPDIYLFFETDNQVVNVQDTDLLETDYHWSTEDRIIEDFEGGDVDFGTVLPADMGEHPAIHIHNSIMRAHRFVLTRDNGNTIEELDVLWPEDEGGSGAYYSSGDKEIHVSPSQQWQEGAPIHEYGHHFLHTQSVATPSDYCNYICDCEPLKCDDHGDCGHCQWCPETDHDAWNEGWPNWFADVVIRSIPGDYSGYTTLYTWSQEITTNTCTTAADVTMPNTNPLSTEGFAGALLRDIEDDRNESQDDLDGDDKGDAPDDTDGDGVNDCNQDAMSLGVDEIFTIVKEDRPTTMVEFLAAFRARYDEHDQDLWSTVRNVTPALGFPVPALDVNLESEECQVFSVGDDLILSVQANGSLLKYQWRRDGAPLANGGRIAGANTRTLTYSDLLDTEGGSYDCVVTSCDGTVSATSFAVRVQVFSSRGGGSPSLMWGRDTTGELGLGSQPPSGYSAPSSVLAINDFVAIAPGPFHTLGLRADGTVWAWGNGSYYQLGRASTAPSFVPIQVPGLSDIVDVKASNLSSFALGADGHVYSWGSNWGRELGRVTPTLISEIPTAIPDLDCVVEINAGVYAIMAIKSDGTVWTWGSNENGLLGLGYASYPGNQTPTQVPGISDAVNGSCGQTHMLVVRADGTVLGWGNGLNGAIGDGTQSVRFSPTPTIGLDNVRFVADGQSSHSIAVKNNGEVWGWGGNQSGELGVGLTAIYVLTPTRVVGVANIVHAATTFYTSVFRRSDGNIWVTGSNYTAGLGTTPGTGGPSFTFTPIQLTSLTNTTYLSAGGSNTAVLAPFVNVAIDEQPAPRTHVVGQTAVFSVAASGTPQLRYQWSLDVFPLVDGGSLTGARTATLTINPVSLGDAGTYTVSVSNAFSSLVSGPADLVVGERRGDANGDGKIDEVDFIAFLTCRSAPGAPPDPPGPNPNRQMCLAVFDIGDDGDVDLNNFADFQNAFDPQE